MRRLPRLYEALSTQVCPFEYTLRDFRPCAPAQCHQEIFSVGDSLCEHKTRDQPLKAFRLIIALFNGLAKRSNSAFRIIEMVHVESAQANLQIRLIEF